MVKYLTRLGAGLFLTVLASLVFTISFLVCWGGLLGLKWLFGLYGANVQGVLLPDIALPLACILWALIIIPTIGDMFIDSVKLVDAEQGLAKERAEKAQIQEKLQKL